MSKAYKMMAEQFFVEKVEKAFPDWILGKINIQTYEVWLSNSYSEVELVYNPDGSFHLSSIKIKQSSDAVVDNEKLTEICRVTVKGLKFDE